MSKRLTIARALDDYVAERAPAVIAVARMQRAAALLKRAVGTVNASDRKAVAASVVRYTELRRGRRKKKISDATIGRDLIVLRAALRHAWKGGRLLNAPYVAIPPAAHPRQRWLTVAEAKALLHQCETETYLFALLAFTTGARLSAMLELTWDRIDLERRIIDFRAPHPLAHRRKHRAVVPIAEPLHRELMRAYDVSRRQRKRRRPDHLFSFGSGREARRRLGAAAADAKLKGVTPHVLRHTAATWMLGEGGVPLLMASAMLGHRSTLITEQVYTHLTAFHLRAAANLLGDMVR